MGARRRGRKRSRSPRRPVRLVLGLGLLAVAVFLWTPSSEPAMEAELVVVSNQAPWAGERVRVDVQNGGGVSGMAKAATQRLRPAGFDVVRFGNAASFDATLASVVVDRIGRPDAARAVANALGIRNVLSEPDSSFYVDVTVLLGRDWRDSTPSPGDGTASGWSIWDPRGWLKR